jgi:hypothetical protein
MVARRPLVSISGSTTELPPGDSVVGVSLGTLTAGSGLNGGGDLSTTVNLSVSLSPNASGLIFADGKLGVDGVARTTATNAIASGNYASTVSATALASGVAGQALANTAIASGNAAVNYLSSVTAGVVQSFTAGSAIASGYAVGLDDNNRVQTIRELVDPDVRTFGTPVVYANHSSPQGRAVYDPVNNKVVVAYRAATTANGTAAVGTISGTSISFGTPLTFESVISNITGTYHTANNRVVYAYTDGGNSNFGTAAVGTVSGTSISFGTPVVFNSASTNNSTSTAYDSANNRIIISYPNVGASSVGTAIVGTVSGTSISFGSPVVFNNNSTQFVSSAYSSTAGRTLFAYTNVGNSSYGTAIIGTVSGTSISFGTAVVFESANTQHISAVYNSNADKVLIAYQDNGNSLYGTASVGTISGTSVSFGAATVFESASTAQTSTAYDSAYNRVIISYQDTGNSSYGTSIISTISGTTALFNTPVVFQSATTTNTSTVFSSSDTKVVVVYNNDGASVGSAAVSSVSSSILPTKSSQDNFIGIAQNTVASGSAVSVRLPGSYDRNNTGLTTGAVYYVNPTTSGFTTTATQPSAWSGAVNWGPVGRAVNSTTLLLTDMI